MDSIKILLLCICALLIPQALEQSYILGNRLRRFIKLWFLFKKTLIGDIYQRKNLEEYLKKKSLNRSGFSTNASYVRIIGIYKKEEEISGVFSDKINTLNSSINDTSFDIEHFHDKYEKTAGTIAKDDLESIINK
jgi:hypothetical protein